MMEATTKLLNPFAFGTSIFHSQFCASHTQEFPLPEIKGFRSRGDRFLYLPILTVRNPTVFRLLRAMCLPSRNITVFNFIWLVSVQLFRQSGRIAPDGHSTANTQTGRLHSLI